MHPNPAFRTTELEQSLAFARSRGFGVLALSTEGPPLISHVPFLLSEDGSSADLHLVRSNPMARLLTTAKAAKLAVSGPDSYVSPDWYEIDDQVPTWNYVAVHLTGSLEQLPQSEMPALLDRLSAHFEAQLLPKPAWTRDKMTPETFDRMLRMIQPFRLRIDDVQSTWKLGQNKPVEARHAAATHMAAQSIGTQTRELAALMHSPFSEPKKD
ncbi:PaiB family negative transcriptional regulator [Shimia isoporae]|uniref:PaiB family negative transcriptional regulator n=1 Tax=Shimia isoporae TaxID=647720 RepID=A0A4R1N3S5_9RHOB|nr:FMN-binding negative transcriptional regulator [Shimia isoporae]TCL01368.1 PaiB family negative transcriptional regulator [Shimia isoporae]